MRGWLQVSLLRQTKTRLQESSNVARPRKRGHRPRQGARLTDEGGISPAMPREGSRVSTAVSRIRPAAGRESPAGRLTVLSICLALAVTCALSPALAQGTSETTAPPASTAPPAVPLPPSTLVPAQVPTQSGGEAPGERVSPSAPGTPAAQAPQPVPGESAAPTPPAIDLPTTGQATSSPTPSGTGEPTPFALPDAGPAAQPQGGIERAHLPHDLSPWGMFIAADIVVQTVMVGLALASFAVWTVWLAKIMELMTARIGLRRGLRELAAEPSLDAAAMRLTRRTAVARGMIGLARTEIELSEDVLNGAGLKERVASRISGLDAALTRRMRRGMSLLATVGATSPFIGLFGTVWGIMNSFIGISKSQTTSLAVVAPGIAEALLATGIGLVAAIPAVILYNQLSRSIATYRALVRETGDEVERLVSRDIDRRAANRPPAALVRRG